MYKLVDKQTNELIGILADSECAWYLDEWLVDSGIDVEWSKFEPQDLIMFKPISYRDDGRFIENETNQELSKDEIIKVVKDTWKDMPADYYSWFLTEANFFDTINKEVEE